MLEITKSPPSIIPPPNIFPITTQNILLNTETSGSYPNEKKAIENTARFAMLCSKPAITKVNTHKNINMILPHNKLIMGHHYIIEHSNISMAFIN